MRVLVAAAALLAVVSMVLAAPPGITAEQAQADANEIRRLWDEHQAAFRGIDGENAVHETTEEAMLAKCETVLAQVQTIETDVLPVIQPFLARIAETYGKTGGAVEWAMKQAGAKDLDWVATRFDRFSQLLGQLQSTRRLSAEYLAGHVRDMPEITFYVQDKRLDMLKQWKVILQWAVKFDPRNAYANQRLATMDREMAALAEALTEEIAAKEWAPSLDDFAGPGTTADLARAAAAFFREDDQWGKAPKPLEILAVSVRGPWSVAATDIFGRVTQWRLPVHLAVTNADYRAKGWARVYELSVVARQGEPGAAPKAPPFEGYWVGDSAFILLGKVPTTP